MEKAEIASLASHAPSVNLLPILKRLLDDNLERFQAFRDQAIAEGWRQMATANEARHPCTWEYKRAFLAIKSPETITMMREYLLDLNFGLLAAEVLVQQWEDIHTSPKAKPFMGGIDFSGVIDRRAARITAPEASTEEADAIFAAVETLFTQNMSTDQLNLAIGLGIAAARLPHGRRHATIQRLIALAPRTARSGLLLSLVLSGNEIDGQVVADGVAETLEAAKTQVWILTESGAYQLTAWLQLLPFVNHPADLMPILRTLPPAQRDPRFLEALIRPLSDISSVQIEEFLFALAEEDPRFYQNYLWMRSVLQLETRSSAIRLVDVTAQGAFDDRQPHQGHIGRELAVLIAAHPALRAHVYDVLKDGPTSWGLSLLARAVGESPDAEGMLLLVKFEKEGHGSFIHHRTLEKVVTEQVPSNSWQGAFEIIPVPATELRQQLLAQVTNGGPTDVAARYLAQIDRIRDEYGMPAKESRHPDLVSGRPWPIISPGRA